MHAEFQINRLAGSRERATARVLQKFGFLKNADLLKENVMKIDELIESCREISDCDSSKLCE